MRHIVEQMEQDAAWIEESAGVESQVALGESFGKDQAHDGADQEQIEESTPLELRDEGALDLTLDGSLAAHGESPEASIERLLSPDTDLLAFSSTLFSSQVLMLFDLLEKLNVNEDNTQELAI